MEHDDEKQVPGQLTQLLGEARRGNPEAEADVVRLAYQQLRRLAGQVAGARGVGVLRPTSLIHEAWLKLHGKLDDVKDREHFFALAVCAMRQILIDEARSRNRIKRGGGVTMVSLSGNDAADTVQDIDVAVLTDALKRLRDGFPRHAEAFELRVLGSLTYSQIGDYLATSESTARGDVQFARAWLLSEIGGLHDE